MVDKEAGVLRGYELRLLRCTLSLPPSDEPEELIIRKHPHDIGIWNLLSSMEGGEYLGALASDATRIVLGDFELDLVDSVDSAERVYSELLDRVESFLVNGSLDEIDKTRRATLVMCLAIAAALWFTRCNMIGSTEGSTKSSIPFKVSETRELVAWENWAKIQLMSVGSDLLGNFSNLQHLVFARMLLLKLKDFLVKTSTTETLEIRSISWWLVRVLLIHQRVLQERSSSLFDMLQVHMSEALDHLGALEKVKSYWAAKLLPDEASSITSTIHLEACILQYTYGRLDLSRLHHECAKAAAGLEFSVTGTLGFRTIHQVNPKAQMVLVVNTNSSNGKMRLTSKKADVGPYEEWGGETSEVYITPRLMDNESEAVKDYVPLKPIEQALILAQCLLIERSSRHDEMQRWDMAPYIEAIDSQESTNFVLRCFCDLLRIRWESTRGRTKGRALEMMEKLVEAINKSDPGASTRIPLYYATLLPTIPALNKEFDELLVNCCSIGEAITIFESPEEYDAIDLQSIGAGGGKNKGKNIPNQLKLDAEARRKEGQKQLEPTIEMPPQDYGDGSKIIKHWVLLYPDLLGKVLNQIKDDCWAISLSRILQFHLNKEQPISQQKELDTEKFIHDVKFLTDESKKVDKRELAVGSLKKAMNYLYCTGLEKQDGRKGSRVYTIKGEFHDRDDATPEFVAHLLETKGPVGIIVDVEFRFVDHKDESFQGILILPKSSRAYGVDRHALIIIAYGKMKDGKLFFVLQNSWGMQWGIKGYGRVVIEKTCDIFYLHRLLQ